MSSSVTLLVGSRADGKRVHLATVRLGGDRRPRATSGPIISHLPAVQDLRMTKRNSSVILSSLEGREGTDHGVRQTRPRPHQAHRWQSRPLGGRAPARALAALDPPPALGLSRARPGLARARQHRATTRARARPANRRPCRAAREDDVRRLQRQPPRRAAR
jgi:hypothetical protein